MQCDKCGGDTFKYGKTSKGEQRYRCKNCFSVINENKKFTWISDTDKEIIEKMYVAGHSINFISIFMRRNYNAIYTFLKSKKFLTSNKKDKLQIKDLIF